MKKTFTAIIAAALLASNFAAYAQPPDRPNNRQRIPQPNSQSRPQPGRVVPPPQNRQPPRPQIQPYQAPHGAMRNAPFVRHDFRRGERLPQAYRHNQYIVTDWQAHRLQRPPRGYHWYQVNGADYVLVSIATGVITAVLINSLVR